MEQTTYTEADFENISWHDNAVYGFYIDRDEEWKSDLVFDIDFITDWLCGTDKTCQFMIAPATLRFHDVSDLKINIDFGDTNFRTILNELSIDGIERERVLEDQLQLDRPYFRWSMHARLPCGEGKIVFGASGFTQILRQEPILCDNQKLPAGKRGGNPGAS